MPADPTPPTEISWADAAQMSREDFDRIEARRRALAERESALYGGDLDEPGPIPDRSDCAFCCLMPSRAQRCPIHGEGPADSSYTPDPAEPYPGAAADRIAALNAFWEVVRKGAAELGIDTADGIDGRLLAAINRGVYASVAALAAAGRLQPAGATTDVEYGVRLTWDDGRVTEDECEQSLADARVRYHAQRRIEVPGWRVVAERIERTVTTLVGPWLPAPTERP